MVKVKAFFYIYVKSLSSIKYYKDLLTTNNAFSMKYFVILATLATTLVTIKTAIPIIPQAKVGTETFFTQVENVFPQELAITVTDGQWQINQPEPYAIPAPKILLDEVELEYSPGSTPEKFPANLIIFDHNGTIEDLENKDTVMVMNGANIIARGGDKIEVYPLRDLPNGTLDRTDFDQFVEKFRPMAKYVPAFVVGAILIGSVFYFFVFRMIYLLFVAVAFTVIASINRLVLPFNTLYKIAVHTFTLPLSIEVLLNLVGFALPIPFWVFLINVVFGVGVLNFLKNANVVHPTNTKATPVETPPTNNLQA